MNFPSVKAYYIQDSGSITCLDCAREIPACYSNCDDSGAEFDGGAGWHRACHTIVDNSPCHVITANGLEVTAITSREELSEAVCDCGMVFDDEWGWVIPEDNDDDDSDDDDDDDDSGPAVPCCPICQSAEAEALGALGCFAQYRCRACGIGFHIDTSPEPPRLDSALLLEIADSWKRSQSIAQGNRAADGIPRKD